MMGAYVVDNDASRLVVYREDDFVHPIRLVSISIANLPAVPEVYTVVNDAIVSNEACHVQWKNNASSCFASLTSHFIAAIMFSLVGLERGSGLVSTRYRMSFFG